MSGYTLVPNTPMIDKNLSLYAKGLYACISSFAGLPQFKMSIARLVRACADSVYSVRKALRELQSSGYLQRYCSTDTHGNFVCAYDMYDTARTTNGDVVFIHQSNRPNGDIQLLRETKGNFTAVPSSILRDPRIPLRAKALYSVTKFLFGIPNFEFSVGAIAAYCKEGAKALRSAWQTLKLTGLLKQHRYPTGRNNAFRYTYDLLESSDMDSPYFTTHRADGSSVAGHTIRGYVDRRKSKIARFIAGVLGMTQQEGAPFPSPAAPHVSHSIIHDAYNAIASGKTLYVNGDRLTRRRRKAILKQLTPEYLDQFSNEFVVPGYVQRPLPYAIAALVRLIESGNQPGQHTQLTADEAETIISHHIRMIRRKQERDVNLSADEQEKLLEYDNLQSYILSGDYIKMEIALATQWIEQGQK